MTLLKKLLILSFLLGQFAILYSYSLPTLPQEIKFGLSENFVPDLITSFSAAGQELNKNMDQFFEQLNISLPKANDGMIQFGKGFAAAMEPAAQIIVSSSGKITSIVVAGVVGSYIAHKYTTRYLFEPALIEKSSKRSLASYLNPLSYRSPQLVTLTNHMVISQGLKENLEYIMNMTKNVKSNGGQFDNVLLYGAPGTGKTLFAELLAQHCGMDYAIVPAANISQFLVKGTVVEELNNLFAWAEKSSRGTIIFLDEAEVFLADRKTLNEKAQNALSSFLAKTGTPSSKIMVICTTNRPEILDPAVLSRLGIKVKFDLPDFDARFAQLEMHIKTIFGNQKGKIVDYTYLKNIESIKAIAEQTEGFSGRALQKCVNAFRQRSLAQNILTIDESLISQAIEQFKQTIDQKS